MKKCDVILSIFYSLITNKKIKKMDVIEEYKLTSITFARYIAEIRDFLAERAPHLELIYNKSKSIYILKEIKKDWAHLLLNGKFFAQSFLFNFFCNWFFNKAHY